MGNVLVKVAKGFGVILIFPFVLLVLLSIFMVQLDVQLLDADIYKHSLDDQKVFDKLPHLIAEQLVLIADFDLCTENPLICERTSPEFLACAQQDLGMDRFRELTRENNFLTDSDRSILLPCLQAYPLPTEQPQEGDFLPYVSLLSISDLESLITILLPSQDTEKVIEDLLGQFFSYAKGQQAQVLLSLSEIKERLAGPEGLGAALTIISSHPACTAEQMTAILFSVALGGTQFELCDPPAEIMSLITPILQIELGLISGAIPDEIVVLQPVDSSSIFLLSRTTLRWMHIILLSSPLLPFLVLVIITLLTVRTLKSWLQWWGFPFFVSGLLTLGVGLLLPAVFLYVWKTFLVVDFPAYISTNLISLGHDLLVSVILSFSNGIIIIGSVLVFIGLGMWITSYLIYFREPEPLAISQSIE